ncbi:Tetraspanin-8 [Heracleum sosnowskyi]|uniref:Tetraspanin-8 n=1 Tax=Heracleum sosnowskyi TaxID=360622 RepID=A0AAD8IE05_9APIA|nr:Tetraspanin-8 [Heracleum sosnowskyi]
MFRSVSGAVVTILNVLAMMFSLLLIGYSVWLYTHDTSLCQRLLRKPLLFIGLALFVVSLMGIIASSCRVSIVMHLYLIFMYLLILALIAFTVFVIVVTNRGVGKQISGIGFKEYRLGDYSNWLQNHVFNGKHWGSVKSCLVDAHVCSVLSGRDYNALNFYKHHLSPLQSGCCKPPVYCGFKFHNATFWTVPKSGPAHQDIDCKTWKNNQNELCFNCISCKAGVLNNVKGQWKTLAIINGCFILLVVIIYSLGCCALKSSNATSSDLERFDVVLLVDSDMVNELTSVAVMLQLIV